MTESAPLILTLGLATADQARFDQLRTAHFPRERNFIGAHITLFHHLPGNDIGGVSATLSGTAEAMAPFTVAVTGLRSRLATAWSGVLTAQDRQGFRPHITVQNKVDPAAARDVLARLSAGFTRFDVEATCLLLWHYRGGPWESAGAFPFKQQQVLQR